MAKMNVTVNTAFPPTVNSEQTKVYHRAHLVITNQPHLQQQQLIQQHLQQKQQQLQQQHQQQQRQNYSAKEEGSSSSSSRKTSASSFFAAIRPRSKSDSVRRKSDRIQNHVLLSDRVI